MANFTNHTDFWGVYTGSHDGRRARLRINDTKIDAAWPVFQITFEDLDRNRTYRNVHHQRNQSTYGEHVLTDVQLDQVGGSDEKIYRKLLLHTWDIDHLTGISVWRDREFGASYQRKKPVGRFKRWAPELPFSVPRLQQKKA